jgi:hypothetical protein
VLRKTSQFTLAVCCLLSSMAHAETYNFFFNEAKNKGQRVEQTAPAPALQAESAQPTTAASGSVTAVAVSSFQLRPSRWKVGFGPMLSSVPYAPPSYSRHSSFGLSRWDRPALVLSLGYRFRPAFAVNTFLGLHLNYDWNPVFGADLEAYPIRVDVGSFDLIELGIVAGASNILTAASTGGIVPHVGARLNINLGSHVTLTTAMRLAEEFYSTEWSLAFNL